MIVIVFTFQNSKSKLVSPRTSTVPFNSKKAELWIFFLQVPVHVLFMRISFFCLRNDEKQRTGIYSSQNNTLMDPPEI